MQLKEIVSYLDKLLNPGTFIKDASLNGLQLGEEKADIQRIAFAVDACFESFAQAAEQKADLVIVHHGLFWGKALALQGNHYKRIKFLMDNKLALYASHLPLDMHPELGNNAGLCRLLGFRDLIPFGEYNGTMIGFGGDFPESIHRNQLVDSMADKLQNKPQLFPFGPEEIKRAAVVSGGAPKMISQAINQNYDIFITGEPSHQTYHEACEAGINVLCGGHYATEVVGLRLLEQQLKKDLGLSAFFIDLPTGL